MGFFSLQSQTQWTVSPWSIKQLLVSWSHLFNWCLSLALHSSSHANRNKEQSWIAQGINHSLTIYEKVQKMFPTFITGLSSSVSWLQILTHFQNPVWRETGRELQVLADAFARSNERLLVRERASQVDILTIDKDKFFAMMAELFQVKNLGSFVFIITFL